jgi:dTDP-4-amino-4,6-dideoxygalactose transaminase
MLGYNSRLDTIQAAILRVKLKYLDQWNSARAMHADYYNKKLAKLGVITPFVLNGNKHIYHQYVIRVKGVVDKESLITHLRANGIDARTYYPVSLHLQECFKYLGYKEGELPESEKAAKETLAIPAYPELNIEQQDFIIAKIEEFLKK